MRLIKLFRSNGHCPVEEFLDSLTHRQAQKVTWVIKDSRRIGNNPRTIF